MLRSCLYPSTSDTPEIRAFRKHGTLKGFRKGKTAAIGGSRAAFLFWQLQHNALGSTVLMQAGYMDEGTTPISAHLLSKRVIVVGCGSVGAPIAEQLTKAGVGHIDIVDPEDLTYANTGRHPLGAEAVGINKALAMATRLQCGHPHATVCGFDLTYEAFAFKHLDKLQSADLIINATANWTAESLLNSQRLEGELNAPTIFTWTESHACAGHAVLLNTSSPCLQCGMTTEGVSKTSVTVWTDPRAGEQTEPACGAVFQPYGFAELQGTISLASSLAIESLIGQAIASIHRVWQAPKILLQQAGGAWNPGWIQGHAERAAGGLQTEIDWEKDDLCPACSSRSTGEASIIESLTQLNSSQSPLPS